MVWAGVGADKGLSGRTATGRNIAPANYLHLVEYGTRNSKAKPFLRPAVDANLPLIQSTVIDRAEKGLNREIKKLDRHTR